MRRILDSYQTERQAAQVLVDNVKIRGVVFEPCAGECNIIKILEHVTEITRIYSNDLDAQYHTTFNTDASLPLSLCWNEVVTGRPDWIVTNPPFSKAHEILKIAIDVANEGIAFLLRLSYLEPTSNRGDWLQEHADQMTRIIPLNPRPRFRRQEINPKTGKHYGTDSVTVAWFVWRAHWSWQAHGIPCPFVFARNWNNKES
jgi:hypothetical protein